jgi:hypothetical protein
MISSKFLDLKFDKNRSIQDPFFVYITGENCAGIYTKWALYRKERRRTFMSSALFIVTFNLNRSFWFDHSGFEFQKAFKPKLLIVFFYVLFLCKCVLYYCYRIPTQLQLTNISIYINMSIYFLHFSIKNCTNLPRIWTKVSIYYTLELVAR